MEEKGFCLKWEKFLDVCKGTFSQLLKNEQFADVTLFCESQLIRCHRLVLSASSQYFHNLLMELNFPNPVIAMHSVKLHDLMAIITFIYTGEVTVSQDQLASLVKLGELLKVKGLGEDEDEKTEQRPASVNKIKKSSSPVERKDIESTSMKRRKVDSDMENGQVHFSQQEEIPLIGVVDVSDSSFLPVKEEAEILDLEPKSHESVSLDEDKDIDLSAYEDQDMIQFFGATSHLDSGNEASPEESRKKNGDGKRTSIGKTKQYNEYMRVYMRKYRERRKLSLVPPCVGRAAGLGSKKDNDAKGNSKKQTVVKAERVETMPEIVKIESIRYMGHLMNSGSEDDSFHAGQSSVDSMLPAEREDKNQERVKAKSERMTEQERRERNTARMREYRQLKRDLKMSGILTGPPESEEQVLARRERNRERMRRYRERKRVQMRDVVVDDIKTEIVKLEPESTDNPSGITDT